MTSEHIASIRFRTRDPLTGCSLVHMQSYGTINKACRKIILSHMHAYICPNSNRGRLCVSAWPALLLPSIIAITRRFLETNLRTYHEPFSPVVVHPRSNSLMLKRKMEVVYRKSPRNTFLSQERMSHTNVKASV